MTHPELHGSGNMDEQLMALFAYYPAGSIISVENIEEATDVVHLSLPFYMNLIRKQLAGTDEQIFTIGRNPLYTRLSKQFLYESDGRVVLSGLFQAMTNEGKDRMWSNYVIRRNNWEGVYPFLPDAKLDILDSLLETVNATENDAVLKPEFSSKEMRILYTILNNGGYFDFSGLETTELVERLPTHMYQINENLKPYGMRMECVYRRHSVYGIVEI